MVWNGSGDNTIITVFQGVNELTNYYMGAFILLLIFGLIYFFNRGEPTRETLVGASFVTMIAAVLLRFVGIVQDVHLGVAVVVFIGTLVMLINRS